MFPFLFWINHKRKISFECVPWLAPSFEGLTPFPGLPFQLSLPHSHSPPGQHRDLLQSSYSSHFSSLEALPSVRQIPLRGRINQCWAVQKVRASVCVGGAAILHSSIRNQEGITVEAEETQRQLDPDSGFADIPDVSKCVEELQLWLYAWSLCMCMWVWRSGTDVRSPPQSISH